MCAVGSLTSRPLYAQRCAKLHRPLGKLFGKDPVTMTAWLAQYDEDTNGCVLVCTDEIATIFVRKLRDEDASIVMVALSADRATGERFRVSGKLLHSEACAAAWSLALTLTTVADGMIEWNPSGLSWRATRP